MNASTRASSENLGKAPAIVTWYSAKIRLDTAQPLEEAIVGLALRKTAVTEGPAVVGVRKVGLALLGALLVGLVDGLPGKTVGPSVVGDEVMGPALGDPALTVGPTVVGERGV